MISVDDDRHAASTTGIQTEGIQAVTSEDFQREKELELRIDQLEELLQRKVLPSDSLFSFLFSFFPESSCCRSVEESSNL